MENIKTFKQWVKDIDPKEDWNFDNPRYLNYQIHNALKNPHASIDIKTLVQWVMTIDKLLNQQGTISELTVEQEINFNA